MMTRTTARTEGGIVQRQATGAAAKTDRMSLAAGLSSVFTAFIASACCVGPLVFALLGLGGAGFLLQLEPYRPYFIGLTAVLLGTGFYLTYRKPNVAPAAEGAEGESCACPAPRASRAGRAVLWIATVLVVVAVAFPYIAAAVWG